MIRQRCSNTEHLQRSNEDDRTKTVTHTVRYIASAEQTVRRFFYGRRIGVYALVNHMQLNSIGPTPIHTISYNKILLHKIIYLTIFSVVHLSK